MKRTPLVQEREVEVLTEQSDVKGLNELRVNEGVNLYVEERMTEEETQNKQFHFETRWENEFDVEKNSYNIRFNRLDTTSTATSEKVSGKGDADQTSKKPEKQTDTAEQTKENIYTEQVVIDKRSTVEDLKK